MTFPRMDPGLLGVIADRLTLMDLCQLVIRFAERHPGLRIDWKHHRASMSLNPRRWRAQSLALFQGVIMQGRIIFDERGEYVSSLAPVEYGPLRPSQLSDAEKSELLPGWAYGDHDDLPYVTTADHRSIEGRIVPLGSECLASRRSGVVQLRVMGERGGTIVLDAIRWCVPVKGAPVLEPSEYPELFLPA